jgi:dihydroorotate dehydrogenase (NAD+) catalytic subunit
VAGLSGPAIRPIAVRMVYEISARVRIPVIGLGGITSAGDALEFIMAGASAVSIGTMNLVDPRAAIDCLEGIESYMKRKNMASVREITGIAHRTD